MLRIVLCVMAYMSLSHFFVDGKKSLKLTFLRYLPKCYLWEVLPTYFLDRYIKDTV